MVKRSIWNYKLSLVVCTHTHSYMQTSVLTAGEWSCTNHCPLTVLLMRSDCFSTECRKSSFSIQVISGYFILHFAISHYAMKWFAICSEKEDLQYFALKEYFSITGCTPSHDVHVSITGCTPWQCSAIQDFVDNPESHRTEFWNQAKNENAAEY